jgi:predicted ATPase
LPPAPEAKPETAAETRDLPLVGREEPSAVLMRCLEVAAHGQQQIPIVTGEAGVGRTRFAEWVAEEAARNGGRVLAGRADETHWMVPFGA